MNRYVISLESGESFYKTMEGTVKSKGVKQRTHAVHIEDGNILLLLLTTIIILFLYLYLIFIFVYISFCLFVLFIYFI